MKAPGVPENEARRIAELRAYEILDSAPDPAFDAITALAAQIMEVPIALISLVDVNRQWFKSRHGLAASQTSRDVSFCGHVVADGASLVVTDAFADVRFADNPLSTGAPHVRFYAGIPLRTPGGYDLGTLCVIDHQPRTPTPKQLESLALLAKLVVDRLEARHQAEAVRRVVDSVPGMLAYWDSEQTCRFANAAYWQWFGIRSDDMIGHTMEDILGPLYSQNRPLIEAALRGEPQLFEREIANPHGGPPRIAQAQYVPHALDGVVHGFAVMVTDISHRKTLEDSLQRSIAERDTLLQEVHHRVKNNLQVISSLINMQLRQLGDPVGKAALAECQRRVLAIALVHEKLYQSADFARIPFSEYARSLTTNIFHALGVSHIKLEVEIDDLALPVDKAIPCGLILNELITNALKHAFPGQRNGTIRVAMARHHGDLVLTVADDGIGIPFNFDLATTTSLGMQLVPTLTEQLDGHLSVSSDNGTTVRVTFPWPLATST